MDSSREFVAAAIEDTQGTIRALDVKIGALLAAILVPLSATGRIFSHLSNFTKQSPQSGYVLIACLFLGAWFFTLFLLVKAIAAIDNPVVHIPNSLKRKGAFYGGGIFPLKVTDAFLNRSSVMARNGLDAFLQNIPATEEDILAELAFEQMKLIYIRDMKMLRLDWAIRFATGWVSLGIIIYLSSRYIVG